MEDNGWILIHRKILDNEIWTNKPDKWFKVWMYLLFKANHCDTPVHPRGGNFTKYEWIQESTGITKDSLKHCIEYLKSSQKIATQKATRGMYFSICNYDSYQTPDATQKATEKPHRRHTGTPTINKELNNKIIELDTNVSNEQSSSEKPPRIDKRNPTVQEIWDYWEELYGTKPDGTAVKNRQAISTLIKRHGVENLKDRMTVIHESRGEPYFPGIFSFMDMRDGENKIQQYFIRVKK